jgi:hypothetical protein
MSEMAERESVEAALPKGSRVRLSMTGLVYLRVRNKDKIGTVVGFARVGSGVRIHWDGASAASVATYARRYLSEAL